MDNNENTVNEKSEITINLFRQRLRSLRTSKNMTLEELAARASTSANYLQLIETGKRTPSITTFMKICQALDVTPNLLLLGTDDRPYSEAVSSIIALSVESEQPLQQLLENINLRILKRLLILLCEDGGALYACA